MPNNNQSKPRAVEYLRRSQDRDDRQSLSIESQDRIVSRLSKENGFLPVRLPPESQSASKPGRPVFSELVNMLEKDMVRHIVTWKASRLARNPKDAGTIIYLMDEGKLLSVVTEGRTYHHSSPEDKQNLWDELGRSKRDTDDLSKNVKIGYATKYERHEYPMEAFTGYVNRITGPGRKNIVPHEIYGSIVTEAFSLAITGNYSLNDIYDFVTAQGLSTNRGNPISKSSTMDMLKRRAYTGTFWHGGAWRKGSYTPLISEEIFQKVQVKMGWAKEKKEKSNSFHSTNYEYKIMECGNCGYGVTCYPKDVQLASGEVKRRIYSTCTKKSKLVKCKEPQVTHDELEVQFNSIVKKINLTEEEAKQCLSAVRKFYQERDHNKQVRLNNLSQQKEQYEQSIVRLIKLAAESDAATNHVSESLREYEQKLARITEQIDKLDYNAEGWLEVAERFFNGSINIGETFKLAKPDEKRLILLEIGTNWKLRNKKVLFTSVKPYDFLINRTDYPNWRARPGSNRRSPP